MSFIILYGMRVARGFGLAELLVSISIFAMVTGLLLANFRQGERNDSVRNAVRQVADMLRKVQNSAVSGVAVPDKTCQGGAVCGFGVRLAGGQAPIYFFDSNGSKSFDSGEEIWGGSQALPTGVTFIPVDKSLVSPLDVIFVPPRGQMVIDGTGLKNVVWQFSRAGAADQTLEINSISGRISY